MKWNDSECAVIGYGIQLPGEASVFIFAAPFRLILAAT
jgi:hypothetical protein